MTPLPARVPLPTCVKGLDPLPEGYAATIRGGLGAALGGADAGEGGLAAIADHVRLLLAWNDAINLSGIRTAEAIAREHVLDSLTAIPILKRAAIDEFVDLGSGGGFPGIPLAVALPARRALLVDSIAKKARFLSGAVEAIGIGDRVAVVATRSETLAGDAAQRGRWGAVMARAVGELTVLAELSLPLLRPGGILVAWKRQPVETEMYRAERALRILGGRISALESVTVPGLEDHVLLVVEKVAGTPSDYPRDPAARRRNPL